MKEILEKIIETDKNAREKVAVQNERLAMIEEEIASEKIGIDRYFEKKAKEEIEKAKSAMQEKLKSEIKRIDKNYESTEKKLKKKYEENHTQWVNDVFDAVTK